MKKLNATLGAAALVLMAGSAQASSLCTGISLGTLFTSDFTLGSVDSSDCYISNVNPYGAAGSAFSDKFGTGWTLLAKMGQFPPYTGSTGSTSLGGGQPPLGHHYRYF